MEARKLNNLVIEITHGDITDCDDDIIVNAANNGLWMGAGVAGAIKAEGGIEIEKEAMEKGPIKPGEAVATRGGRLKARFVIHAAVMGQDLRTNARYIREAIISSLDLADELGMGSIAFPALGTGVGRFPIDECAEIMFDQVKKFDLEMPAHVKRIRFVLFSKQAYEIFKSIYLTIPEK
jgi:O-acetyl-ADP-ribose deacetylase (regulator of RNase III)